MALELWCSRNSSRLLNWFSLAFLLPALGCEPGQSRNTTARSSPASTQLRSLDDLSSFGFYSTSGIFRVYKAGRLIEEKPDNEYSSGTLRFTILGGGKGLISGNQGTGELRVYRTGNSISLIETTPSGDKHVLTILGETVPGTGGFKATYERSITGFGEMLRSSYEGYVK